MALSILGLIVTLSAKETQHNIMINVAFLLLYCVHLFSVSLINCYAECCHAECRFIECRGALKTLGYFEHRIMAP